MKKNNKGFALIETLIVSTFVITTLTYLYIQFSTLNNNYKTSFNYDTVSDLYYNNEINKFIINNYEYNDFMNDVDNSENGYVELYKNGCKAMYFSDKSDFCNKLMYEIDAKYVIFSKSDLTKLKTYLTTNNPYSNKLKNYINRLNIKEEDYKYLIITEFNDGTVASTIVEKGDIDE